MAKCKALTGSAVKG